MPFASSQFSAHERPAGPPLPPLPIPGLIVTATDTGVGKTLIAAAIAQTLHRAGQRVAVVKPAGSGCVRRREGLVSEDAEFLAHCADSPHPLDLICPQRYAEPLAPAVAAQRAGQPLDWPTIDRSIQLMCRDMGVMIVEGVGGALVPMDDRFLFADLARALAVPAVIVARPGLGTINHTLLTAEALRARGITIAGVIINRYPPDGASVAEETNPRIIERFGRLPILAIVPDVPRLAAGLVPPIPSEVLAPIGQVDWTEVIGRNRR